MAASFGRNASGTMFPWRKPQLIAVLAAAGAMAAVTGGAQVSDRARRIQADALVFDGHVHAIDREFYHGGDIGERKPDGMWDLSRAREGGLKALFLSAYVPED